MSSSIKCPKCKTWNHDEDRCLSCGEVLNLDLQRAIVAESKRIEQANRPKDWYELYYDRIKASDKTSDRVMYYIINSVGISLVLFVTGLLAIVAFGPG
jgi:hypothetical protein